MEIHNGVMDPNCLSRMAGGRMVGAGRAHGGRAKLLFNLNELTKISLFFLISSII